MREHVHIHACTHTYTHTRNHLYVLVFFITKTKYPKQLTYKEENDVLPYYNIGGSNCRQLEGDSGKGPTADD